MKKKLLLITRLFAIASFIGACTFFLQDASLLYGFKTTLTPISPTENLALQSSRSGAYVSNSQPSFSTPVPATDSSAPTMSTAPLANEQILENAKILSKSSYDEESSQCLTLSEPLWTISSMDNSSTPQCSPLIKAIENGNESSLALLFDLAATWTLPDPHTNSSLLAVVENCTEFLENVKFADKPGSQEEADFPLAYVFMAHRNPAQTIRLFRMLYQPQNAYCITYDTKSNEDYIGTIIALASCFPRNVYLTPRPEPIHYFGYSILHSAMECMKVLTRSSIPWRYVQVVSWNDFPLRTNWEMVQIFKILNGSQDSELMQMNTPEHYILEFGENGARRRSIAPKNLIVYKGSFATSMTREFIDFILSSSISMEFYRWLYDVKGPEEFYWPTLIHNLQLNAPGGFPGECEPYYTVAATKKPFLSRFQAWIWEPNEKPCKGTYINWSCVYGVGDLPMLLRRPELMAHKVYEEFQPALSRCLEEWHWQRTCARDNGRNFGYEYYKKLPSVLYHKLSKEEKDKYVCS